jgi:hypothetical protein
MLAPGLWSTTLSSDLIRKGRKSERGKRVYAYEPNNNLKLPLRTIVVVVVDVVDVVVVDIVPRPTQTKGQTRPERRKRRVVFVHDR